MRPQKIRMVEVVPAWTCYLPDGSRGAADMLLSLDMVEALRLVDAEGLSQDAAAERMGISKPTLCRLLGTARCRVATALRDGLSIVCSGGNVQLRPQHGRGPQGPGGPRRRGRQAAGAWRAGPGHGDALQGHELVGSPEAACMPLVEADTDTPLRMETSPAQEHPASRYGRRRGRGGRLSEDHEKEEY